jgi:hypothetical protein
MLSESLRLSEVAMPLDEFISEVLTLNARPTRTPAADISLTSIYSRHLIITGLSNCIHTVSESAGLP